MSTNGVIAVMVTPSIAWLGMVVKLGLMVAICCLILAMCYGLVCLFSSHRARAALAVALVGALAILGLFTLIFLYRSASDETPATATVWSAPGRPAVEAGDRPLALPPGPTGDRADVPLASAATPGAAAGRPAQPRGLLRMLSGAVLRALDDDDALQPGGEAASETSHVETAEAEIPSPSAPRPAWIDAAPHREGSEYQMPVVVGPYTSREECDKKLPEELLRAVDTYAVHLLGPRASGRVQLPLDYLQGSLVRQTWEERRVFPLSPSLHSPMVQLHVLVGFDAKAAEKIRNAWKQIVVEERVYRLAAVGIVLLLSLTIAWAYLRLDLSTAGRYRWRLRLAAAAAMVAVVVFGLRLS